MRTFFHLLFIALTIASMPSFCFADEATELDKLKTSYVTASERALAPVTATYKRELERLRDSYVKSGKLAEALLVKEELESLTVTVSSEKRLPKRELEKELVSSSWTYYPGGESEDQKGKPESVVVFKKDQTASRTGMKDTTWEINKEGDLIFLANLPAWVCKLKRKSETLWVGVRIGTNAGILKYVHLEKKTD